MITVEILEPGHDLSEAHAVRMEVFVVEQGVPIAEEVDDADHAPTTIHAIARRNSDGLALGTARLLAAPRHLGVVHIGRVAVRAAARRAGVGAALMAALEDVALQRYAQRDIDGVARVRVVLSAQLQALGFYQGLGYEPYGPIYLDAAIEHREAAKVIEV